jgi:hypothetical protein
MCLVLEIIPVEDAQIILFPHRFDADTAPVVEFLKNGIRSKRRPESSPRYNQGPVKRRPKSRDGRNPAIGSQNL